MRIRPDEMTSVSRFWRRTGILVFGLLVTVPAMADELGPLTLERLFESPSLFGVAPSTPVWSPDSRHVAFTWNDAGMPSRGLWVVASDGSGLRRLDTDEPATGSVSNPLWLPDGETLLTLRGGELWSTSLTSSEESLLASLGRGAHDARLSPDGSSVAYLKDGDLWLFDLEETETVRLTNVGIPRSSALTVGRYNRPEREIGPGIWGGPTFAWSHDGSYIAVHHVDRRSMDTVPFPDYLGSETDPNEVRRGYPGDANESRTVGLVDVNDGGLRLLDLDDPTGNQVVGFSWSTKGELLLDVAADTAIDRRLYTLSPEENQLTEIWHGRRDSRMYTSFASAWLPDGEHVVVLSDREDRYGLYVINASAPKELPTRLTDAGHDVFGAPSVVSATNSLVYAGNGPTPYERHVYTVDVSDGSSSRLTTMPGQNAAVLSPDGRHLAILHSSDEAPTDLYLMTMGDGTARRATVSPVAEFRQRQWARARYVSFPSLIDDYTLHARILEPANRVPGRVYPVVFGPMYSNTVRNRWAGIYTAVQQLLVQKGYIVVQVDVRGSTGYGRQFREEFLVDFAGDDIEDIASAVEYMKSLEYVDAERFGIWGSSYGGTLSVYTLLKKPGLFRAGVAAAAAVDPFFFGTDDVAIVRRPDTHPDIFENKAIRFAENLEDHLLLIHGMQDQVVPFKTVAVLSDELIRLGKDFDTAFVPGATHSWSREPGYSRYLFSKLLEHFDRYLMTEAAGNSAD